MTQEAKKAAKLEKKLKILLGGYQVFIKLDVSIACWILETWFSI
jgi:hypothetical protein